MTETQIINLISIILLAGIIGLPVILSSVAIKKAKDHNDKGYMAGVIICLILFVASAIAFYADTKDKGESKSVYAIPAFICYIISISVSATAINKYN